MTLAIPGDSTKINKLIEQLNNKGQLCDNRNCTNNNILKLNKFVSYWKPRDDGSQSFNPYTMFRLCNRCKDGVFNGTIKRVFLNDNHPIYEGKSNDPNDPSKAPLKNDKAVLISPIYDPSTSNIKDEDKHIRFIHENRTNLGFDEFNKAIMIKEEPTTDDSETTIEPPNQSNFPPLVGTSSTNQEDVSDSDSLADMSEIDKTNQNESENEGEALPAEALPAEALPAETLPAENLPAEALPNKSQETSLNVQQSETIQDSSGTLTPIQAFQRQAQTIGSNPGMIAYNRAIQHQRNQMIVNQVQANNQQVIISLKAENDHLKSEIARIEEEKKKLEEEKKKLSEMVKLLMPK